MGFWNNISRSTLREVAAAVGVRTTNANALADLEARYPQGPTRDLVMEIWPVLRDGWLERSSAHRRDVIDRCRQAKLGDLRQKITTKPGQLAYLRSLRRSDRLADIVLEVFTKSGERDRPEQAWEPTAELEQTQKYEQVVAQLTSVLDRIDASSLADYELQVRIAVGAALADIELPAADTDDAANLVTANVLFGLAVTPLQVRSGQVGLPHHAEVLAGLARHRGDVAFYHTLLAMFRGYCEAALSDPASTKPMIQGLASAMFFALVATKEIVDLDPGLFERVTAGQALLKIESVTEHAPALTVSRDILSLEEFLTAAMAAVPGASAARRSDTGTLCWTVTCGSSVTLVRVLKEVTPGVPGLRLQSRLLESVPATPELLRTLNDINARDLFHKVYWADNGVMLEQEFTATTLTLDQVYWTLSRFLSHADRYDTSLQERFGGKLLGSDVAASFDA